MIRVIGLWAILVICAMGLGLGCNRVVLRVGLRSLEKTLEPLVANVYVIRYCE